jgi:hypothetical protein
MPGEQFAHRAFSSFWNIAASTEAHRRWGSLALVEDHQVRDHQVRDQSTPVWARTGMLPIRSPHRRSTAGAESMSSKD